jgi:hypothetical protein
MASKLRNSYNRGFVLDYAALFSGRSVYKYVSGYPRPYMRTDFIDVLSVLPWILCAGYAVGVLADGNRSGAGDKVLAAGWLIEAIAYDVIAGPGNLEPAYDRYGLCLIVPGITLFVRAMQGLMARRAGADWGARLITVLLSGVLLVSFYNCYFRYIMTTGGTAGEPLQTSLATLSAANGGPTNPRGTS